jgi:hypothetical protein
MHGVKSHHLLGGLHTPRDTKDEEENKEIDRRR